MTAFGELPYRSGGSRYACGCRRRSVRKRGHRPQCLFHDPARANDHRSYVRVMRRIQERENPTGGN